MTDAAIYINQLDYEDVEYRTHASNPEDETFFKHGNIGCAGCGLCSGSMLVSYLTGRQMNIETFRDLAYLSRSNSDIGTDMQIYSRALADRFNLISHSSDNTDELIKCLLHGGAAIINVGGDHDDHIGIFSDVGHYIFAKGFDRNLNEIEILDPAFRKDKFSIPGRREYVRVKDYICYASPAAIELDTQNRTPAFYLFYAS
jgi:hypothetical protein